MPKSSPPPGKIRLIAGTWRGRKLSVPDLPGLRPTPDRLRETLFNWLAPLIEGARCLDLFAGSGALGLEAASRGAQEVLLVERQAALVRHLAGQIALLQAKQVRVIQADALQFLRGPARPFDLVLLDPPYAAGLLEPCCALLAERGWLAEGARIYLETEREQVWRVPENWRVERESTVGQARGRLLRMD
jgi:16S rRNA (guanine966-N2)-methyltransferase